jgi:integrase
MAGRRQHGEGSLYQRKSDSRWIAVVDLGWKDGKRHRRVFTGATPEAAMTKRTRWLDLRRSGFTLPKGRIVTVGEWCAHWLANVAEPKVAANRLAATTFHGSYRSKVDLHIIPFFAQTPLNELCEEDIEAWHRHLGKNLSAASITQCHRILSSAIKVAVIRGRIPRNPVSNVPPPQPDHEAAVPTAEETALILERCKTWHGGARWILAIATGARQGEILALRWSDVILPEPAGITISRSAARVRGELTYKQPKSRQSRRTIQIGPATVAALKAHRKTQVTNINSDLVFTDRRGQPVHPRADWQDFQDLLADLGLPRYPVHSLRHATATLLLEAGQDTRVVQTVLGHATPGFTAARYQHVRPRMHAAAADAMNSIIEGR